MRRVTEGTTKVVGRDPAAVLELMGEDLPTKEIAKRLYLSPSPCAPRPTPQIVDRLSPMTKSVGVHAAKTHLSQLLAAVARGESVEITNRGVVVARLVPPVPAVRTLGLDTGRYEVPDDFDAPLPEAVAAAFET